MPTDDIPHKLVPLLFELISLPAHIDLTKDHSLATRTAVALCTQLARNKGQRHSDTDETVYFLRPGSGQRFVGLGC